VQKRDKTIYDKMAHPFSNLMSQEEIRHAELENPNAFLSYEGRETKFDIEHYDQEFTDALNDPAQFWDRKAEAVHWFKKYD